MHIFENSSDLLLKFWMKDTLNNTLDTVYINKGCQFLTFLSCDPLKFDMKGSFLLNIEHKSLKIIS